MGNLVTKSFIGVTLPEWGVEWDISMIVYKTIYKDFNSQIKINQFNGNAEDDTQKKLAACINMVIEKKNMRNYHTNC